MRLLRAPGPLLLLLLAAAVARAQAPAQIEFRFENPKLQPAVYVIQLHEDGSGRFHSEVGSVPPDDIADLPAKGQDRDIQVSKALADRAFATAKHNKYFTTTCDSGNDSIAFQGKKTLSYTGPKGQGSCSYNYSKDSQIEWLTTQLQGVATTLEEDRKLQLEHEHSPLMLDAELETLETLVQNGQATELGNAAPTLRGIVEDDRLLERAQRRARKLLTLSESAQSGK